MINLGHNDVYTTAVGFLINFNTLVNFVFTKPWILDSEVTDHIVSNLKLFFNSTSSPVSLVNLSTGSTTPITSKETIQFNRNIKLEHALCVLSFYLNFISANNSLKLLSVVYSYFPMVVSCKIWLRRG